MTDNEENQGMNEMQRIRAKNLAERDKEWVKLKAAATEFDQGVEEDIALMKSTQRAARRESDTFVVRARRTSDVPSRRSSRLSGVVPMYSYQDLAESDEESEKKRRKLEAKFPFGSKVQPVIRTVTSDNQLALTTLPWNEMMLETGDVTSLTEDYDEAYLVNLSKLVKKVQSHPHPLPADEVTELMIKGINYKSTDKVYHKEIGTSCHQCRQKTLDTKTVCRNLSCGGVRGQFCGFCLQTRYAENAERALKDPTWSCPCCRGMCNCSICRNKSGVKSTGSVELPAGDDSVMHYLALIDGVPSSDIPTFLRYHNVALTYKGRPLKMTYKVFADLCLKSKFGLENLAVTDIPFLNPEDRPFINLDLNSSDEDSGSLPQEQGDDAMEEEVTDYVSSLISDLSRSQADIDVSLMDQSAGPSKLTQPGSEPGPSKLTQPGSEPGLSKLTQPDSEPGPSSQSCGDPDLSSQSDDEVSSDESSSDLELEAGTCQEKTKLDWGNFLDSDCDFEGFMSSDDE